MNPSRGLLLAVSALAVTTACTEQNRIAAHVGRRSAEFQAQPAVIQMTNFSHSGRVERLSNVMIGTTFVPAVSPVGWPAEVVWRPLRHFGPFTTGSELTSIVVKLGGNGAAVYYDGFFTGHPDRSIFQKYYGTLPSSDAPSGNHVPGEMASGDGFNDVLLGLQRIRYSSKYGGSVQLSFASLEGYELEAAKGTTHWDVSTVLFDVFVSPRPGINEFNPTHPRQAAGLVNVELRGAGIQAYRRETNTASSIPLTPLEDSMLTDLNALFTTITTAIETNSGYNFRTGMERFVYGFIHSQFQDLIGPNEIVDTLKLSDDFLDVHTRTGEGVFIVSYRVNDVNLDTEPGDEEIEITVIAEHVFTPGGLNPLVMHDFDRIGNRDGTSFATLGIFRLDQCDRLQQVKFSINLHEQDAVSDDAFILSGGDMTVDCTELNTRFTSGTYGTVDQVRTDGLVLINFDDEVKGAMSVTARLALFLR